MPTSPFLPTLSNVFETHASPAVGVAAVDGGWFGDYLRDPDGTLSRLTAHLWEWAVAWAPGLVPVLVALAVAEIIGRWWWARRCHRRLLAGARQVTVLAPPTV